MSTSLPFPLGARLALALRDRLLAEGIAVTIAAEPKPGTDYLDLWVQNQSEDA